MTVRLAVVSDTHLAAPSPWFEAIYERHLAEADLLVHCGDATGFSLWSYLVQHPNFQAVAGNSDAYDLAATLPQKLDLPLPGARVTMVHGWGPRPGLAERIATVFAGRYDLVFFGHSHAAEDVTHAGIRLINPGSCRPGGSLALIDWDPAGCDVRFLSL